MARYRRYQRREITPEEIEEKLISKVKEVEKRVADNKLPGSDEFVEENESAKEWIGERYRQAKAALRDLDEIRLERALLAWEKGWGNVNKRLAEKYRENNPTPEEWELRYLKWMDIESIRFSSPLGDFYVYPRRPKNPPEGVRWYTADEMIDMLHPGVAAAINAFGALPVRPESLDPPGVGEKHLRVDLTGEEPSVKASWTKMR